MNNEENLLEYLKEHNSKSELENLMLDMAVSMEFVHEKGCYIKSMASSNITMVDGIVRYDKTESVENIDKDKKIFNNIYNLAYSFLGYYTRCSDFLTPNAAKENFSSFESYLPTEDVEYFKRVLIDKESINYYNWKKEEQEKRGSQGKESSRVLVKGNGVAKFNANTDFEDKENLEDKYNPSLLEKVYFNNKPKQPNGFMTLVLFPAVVIFLFLMVSLAYWIIALS